jgi:DNA polymerase III delta prime subunit
MDGLLEQITAKVAEVDRQYHRLVLLVGMAGCGKTSALFALANQSGAVRINVNQALSERLLELTPSQRRLRIAGIMEELVNAAGNTVLLDNFELLFDPNLQQDPLRLMQGLSRNRTVVAAWNGNCIGDKLTYAEPGHGEYRAYATQGLCIVNASSAPAEETA